MYVPVKVTQDEAAAVMNYRGQRWRFTASRGNRSITRLLSAWKYLVCFCSTHVLLCPPEFPHMQASSAPTTYFLFPVFVFHAASDDGPSRIFLCMKDKNLSLSARQDSLCLALPHHPVLHTTH